MGTTVERGREGEAWAAEFLRARGYDIIEANYRWRGGEIDLVARDGECLVFVEVKRRASDRFGSPEEAITAAKRDKLIHTARRYLMEHPTELDVRFDVVALSRGRARLHQNAFTPEG